MTHPREPAPQDLLGRALNQRFELLELIGMGGMSYVFKALDLRQQEIGEAKPYVAVKILRPSFQTDPRFVALLAHEAKKAQQLSHPHIVNVFGFDRDDQLMFMIMELMEGQSLEQMLAGDKLPPSFDQRVQLALQIIDAVIYAHQQQVIHADIKPGNIFIEQYVDAAQQLQYKAKIFDFGISKALSEARSDAQQTLVACSPAYATPARVHGAAAQATDDAYGLGCVVYSILAGCHPFARKSSIDLHQPTRDLQKIPGLTSTQWHQLQRLLLFPFYPNDLLYPDDSRMPASESAAHTLAQTISVTPWIVGLRQSLLQTSQTRSRTTITILSALLILMLGFSGYWWWMESIQSRQQAQLQLLVSEARWLEVLEHIEAFAGDGEELQLSAAIQQQTIQGLVETIAQALDSLNPAYKPDLALRLIAISQRLFPEAPQIAQLAQAYPRQLMDGRNHLRTLIETAAYSSDFCFSDQQSCRHGLTFYGQQLGRADAMAVETLEPVLLQGFVKGYARAFYQNKFNSAQKIREQALLFFSPQQLAELGVTPVSPDMLASSADNNGDHSLQTALDSDQGAKHASLNPEALIKGIQKFKGSDGSFDELADPFWMPVRDYLVAFQSLSPQPASFWFAQPVSDALQPYFNNAAGIDMRRKRVGSNDLPSAIDTCQLGAASEPQSATAQRTFQCQDKVNGVKGPVMRSLWLKHAELISKPYQLAVAQYELSWADLAQYCQTHDCPATQVHQLSHPVHGLTALQLEDYLRWLSEQTGFRYRLLTLTEWRVLADPLGLMNDLVQNNQRRTVDCEAPGYKSKAAQYAALNVTQGTVDRFGLYNLADMLVEAVRDHGRLVLVPGRDQRLQRCRLRASAYEYPYAGYRVVRDID